MPILDIYNDIYGENNYHSDLILTNYSETCL